MTFLRRLLGAQESGFSTWGPADDRWYGERGAPTQSGAVVSVETANTIATVFRCVAIIAEGVAQLPIELFRDDQVEVSAVAQLLSRSPNPEDSAFEFREKMVASALLRGRGYARIHPGPLGPISELEPLPAACIREERITGTRRLRFVYRPQGSAREEVITQDEMFVLRGPAHAPRGIVAAARESFGLTLAQDRFGAAQFGRKPQMTGVIEVPGVLKDDKASERMARSFVAATSGEGNWFLPGVLEAGAQWKTVGMSMADAQWLDGRKFQGGEVCRWFGVPPHMVGYLDGQGYGSVEQLSIEFVRTCLRPWVIRFEQAADRDLLIDEAVRAELDMEELSRGDTAARYTAHRIALGGNAFKSPDEVRDEEGLPRRGGKWDEIPVQLNTKIGSDPKEPPNNDPGAPNA